MMKFEPTVIGVELENAGRLSMTRTNWMANKAMPDSIMTKTRERKFLPPLTTPKDFSTEVEPCWTFRNALKILYTIKPVTRAFTAMEMATLMLVAIKPQRVT